MLLWIFFAAWSYTPNNRNNYDDAQADCVAQGGNLASFETAADFAASRLFLECSK